MPTSPFYEAAEKVRKLGQRTPWWELVVEDGQPLVRDKALGEVVFSIHGVWTPDLVRLLGCYGTDAIVALPNLLWAIGNEGATPRVRSAAERLVTALDLDGTRAPQSVRDALHDLP